MNPVKIAGVKRLMTVESVCASHASKLLPRPPLLKLNLGERWYVVHTLPACEIRAQLQLGNRGFRFSAQAAKDGLPCAQTYNRNSRIFSRAICS